MEEKSRLSRLTEIITQLQSKRILTASFLSKKYSVSLRTIYRDIRTLTTSGIPIVFERDKGYSLMDGYQLPPVMFTESEANAMITAEQLIRNNSDQSFSENYSSAVAKIRSILKSSQKDKVDLLADRIHVKPNGRDEKSSSYLMTLQLAIINFQLLEIKYISLQNKLTTRKIEPFAVCSTQGNWILIAYCQLRNDFRAFRVDLVQQLIELHETFEPHNITLEEYLKFFKKK